MGWQQANNSFRLESEESCLFMLDRSPNPRRVASHSLLRYGRAHNEKRKGAELTEDDSKKDKRRALLFENLDFDQRMTH